MKVVLIITNSVGPDEMQHYAALHLGLHCLPKYPFRGFQNTKGKCMALLQANVSGSYLFSPGLNTADLRS